ncbi:MAG TPA: hypothetical protein DCQ31_11825 [Bacteroidales bacterium]|nr:hypothetical protein [Bacteroidales bacterium]
MVQQSLAWFLKLQQTFSKKSVELLQRLIIWLIINWEFIYKLTIMINAIWLVFNYNYCTKVRTLNKFTKFGLSGLIYRIPVRLFIRLTFS